MICICIGLHIVALFATVAPLGRNDASLGCSLACTTCDCDALQNGWRKTEREKLAVFKREH